MEVQKKACLSILLLLTAGLWAAPAYAASAPGAEIVFYVR